MPSQQVFKPAAYDYTNERGPGKEAVPLFSAPIHLERPFLSSFGVTCTSSESTEAALHPSPKKAVSSSLHQKKVASNSPVPSERAGLQKSPVKCPTVEHLNAKAPSPEIRRFALPVVHRQVQESDRTMLATPPALAKCTPNMPAGQILTKLRPMKDIIHDVSLSPKIIRQGQLFAHPEQSKMAKAAGEMLRESHPTELPFHEHTHPKSPPQNIWQLSCAQSVAHTNALEANNRRMLPPQCAFFPSVPNIAACPAVNMRVQRNPIDTSNPINFDLNETQEELQYLLHLQQRAAATATSRQALALLDESAKALESANHNIMALQNNQNLLPQQTMNLPRFRSSPTGPKLFHQKDPTQERHFPIPPPGPQGGHYLPIAQAMGRQTPSMNPQHHDITSQHEAEMCLLLSGHLHGSQHRQNASNVARSA